AWTAGGVRTSDHARSGGERALHVRTAPADAAAHAAALGPDPRGGGPGECERHTRGFAAAGRGRRTPGGDPGQLESHQPAGHRLGSGAAAGPTVPEPTGERGSGAVHARSAAFPRYAAELLA